MTKKLLPTSPGEMLLKEFLEPMNITQYRLAKDLGIPQTRISKIIKGERAITSDTALRLAYYFNMSAEFWMNLQTGYDLKCAKESFGAKILKEVHPLRDAA
jgi:addiction module HigA family antidote